MNNHLAHIRSVIRLTTEARRTIETMKPAERIARDDIGPYLDGLIKRLKELHIPKNYSGEAIIRDAELGACEDAVRRWLRERGQSYLIQRVPPEPVVEFVNIGEAIAEARREPEERLYGRGGVVLRVIDGGKK